MCTQATPTGGKRSVAKASAHTRRGRLGNVGRKTCGEVEMAGLEVGCKIKRTEASTSCRCTTSLSNSLTPKPATTTSVPTTVLPDYLYFLHHLYGGESHAEIAAREIRGSHRMRGEHFSFASHTLAPFIAHIFYRALSEGFPHTWASQSRRPHGPKELQAYYDRPYIG